MRSAWHVSCSCAGTACSWMPRRDSPLLRTNSAPAAFACKPNCSPIASPHAGGSRRLTETERLLASAIGGVVQGAPYGWRIAGPLRAERLGRTRTAVRRGSARGELRADDDFGNARERLRHRAVLFRELHLVLEQALVDARNVGGRLELDLRDGGARFEMYERRRIDALRRVTFLRELRGEEHREASGLRCADELFGRRALARSFEARRIGERRFEVAVSALHGAVALLQSARPRRLCFGDRHASSFLSPGRYAGEGPANT